jgi:hypothetical protein
MYYSPINPFKVHFATNSSKKSKKTLIPWSDEIKSMYGNKRLWSDFPA